MLHSRFARVRARPAHRDYWLSQLRDEVRLLVEWPKEEPEPTKYWLSNLPTTMAIEALVATTKARWRIERDYEELKQQFGLGHYEGRGWGADRIQHLLDGVPSKGDIPAQDNSREQQKPAV